ncbi:MAG: EamA family transporter, partial [Anaerolineales bacterium]
ALPMAIGGGLLLIAAPPLPVPAARTLAILVFLGIVNSALAYILWNHALKQLQAFEISVLGNLIPIGTALLAPGILAERLMPRSWIGIAAALVGVILVAWAGRRPSQPVPVVVARLSESGPLS